MGHVTEQGEQRQHGQQAAGETDPDPGAQLQPHHAAPPAQSPGPPESPESPGPPAIDAETYRQFQQFQQFQEFQRFQELQQTGEYGLVEQQPARRRIRAPRWLRWLAKKLLSWLIFAVLTVLALYWLFDAMFGSSSDDGKPVADTGGGKQHDTVLLKRNPYEAVRSVYDAIAQGKKPSFTCGRFDEDNQIQREFAENLNYRDCAQAARQLHERVDDVNGYAESIPSSTSKPIKGDTVTVSSCDFDITGGPALGTFTLTKIEHGQWIITGHEKGPEPCPETSEGGTAPTR